MFFLDDTEDVNFIFSGNSKKLLELIINETNNMLVTENVVVTENGTIIDLDDDLLYIQGGGVNKTTKHWWGFNLYMKTDRAKDWIHEINQSITLLTAGYSASAALAGLASFGTGAVFTGVYGTIHVTTLKLIKDDAVYKNNKQKNGIRVKWHLVIIGTLVYCQ